MDETQPLLGPASKVHDDPERLDEASGKNGEPNGKTEVNEYDPLTWSPSYKWAMVLLLAYQAFTITFCCMSLMPLATDIISSLSPPGAPSNPSSAVLLVTIWELGEAAGPLLVAPLSEYFGRYAVFNTANVLFIGSVLLSALSPTVGVLIFARFLSGVGVAGNVLNPAIIGDMFPAASRGSPMALVLLAPLTGGAVGPFIAGYIAQVHGWRSTMWTSLVLAGVGAMLFATMLRETYAPAILKGKEDRTAEEESKTCTATIWTSIARPARLFMGSLVLQLLSLYSAAAFAFFYIMSTTLPRILSSIYGFSPSLIGSCFLAFSLGSFLGIFILNTTLDRLSAYLAARTVDKEPQPEHRLPLSITGSILLPASILLYGWITDQHLPVGLLLASVSLMGCSLMLSVLPLMTYIVDATPLYSASALTAVLVCRCLSGSFLPLVTDPLVANLGWGGGFTVLAAGMAMLAPIPMVVWQWGKIWRGREKCLVEGPV